MTKVIEPEGTYANIMAISLVVAVDELTKRDRESGKTVIKRAQELANLLMAGKPVNVSTSKAVGRILEHIQ